MIFSAKALEVWQPGLLTRQAATLNEHPHVQGSMFMR